MALTKNLGSADRVIRLLIAVVIAVLYMTHAISGTVAIILGLLALIFAVTSTMSFCPLYWAVGFKTKKD